MSFKRSLKCGECPKQIKYDISFLHTKTYSQSYCQETSLETICSYLHMIYRSNETLSFSMAIKFLPSTAHRDWHFFPSPMNSQWSLCGVKLIVFATFRWSRFWNYFVIITCSGWSLRRKAKQKLERLLMTSSGMLVAVNVWCFFFQVTCEHRLSHAQHPSDTRSCLVTLDVSSATLHTVISEFVCIPALA